MAYGLADGFQWMAEQLSHLSDYEIIMGVIYSYKEPACTAEHYKAFKDALPTDECRGFRYISGQYDGMQDHLNMRQFAEWCAEHRPHIPSMIEKYKKMMVFW